MYKVNAWFKDKVYLNDDDYIDSIAQYDQTNSNKNFKMQTKDYHTTKVKKKSATTFLSGLRKVVED